MTPSKAKAITLQALSELGFDTSAFQLRARTVDFMDLARGGCIFVRVIGWKPNPLWLSLRQIAKDNGFRVET